MMHYGQNPLPVAGKVIKQKNSHYEIFKILSQNKLDKVKNNLGNVDFELLASRMDLIDARIR